MNLTIQIAQLDLLVGDVEGNARRVIEAAGRARADAIVFPELTLTGYPPEDLLLRDDFIERVELALRQVREAAPRIHLILGYPSRHQGRLYNTAGVLYAGETLVEYHKQKLPNYSVFDEKRYFTPGHSAGLFSLRGVPVGLTICEDIWTEQPAAMARGAGARLLLNLNASPFHTGKAPEREELVGRRAREQAMPIVYANLVGGQDELVFDGGSFVVDGAGELTQRLPYYQEAEVPVVFEVSGETLRPLPGELGPPPDELEAIYRTLVLGIRDYVQKNGFNGAILGLSGGIDSALTLALAVDALGPEQVEVVLMPSRYTAPMSIEDAVAEAEALGVEYRTLSIEPAYRAFLEILEEEFAGLPADVTEENIQARCRGILLMAISNKKGRILLTTGNKSEMSVGYATLYGDMAGGFAPIKDVPKTLVYRLSEYRNGLSPVIPRRVLERPPSAELAPGQQDSDSLPDYAILDPILERYVEQDQSPGQIVAAGFDAGTVARVVRLVDRNEYKRRQAPPGIKITRRAYGRDRRYPLTRG